MNSAGFMVVELKYITHFLSALGETQLCSDLNN